MGTVLAALAGAGIAGALQVFLAPDFLGESLFAAKVLVVFAGNATLALLAGLIARLLGGSAAVGLVLGLGVGLIPIALAWTGLPWLGLVALLAVAAAARTLGRRWRVPTAAVLLPGLLTLVLPYAAATWMSIPPVKGHPTQQAALAPYGGSAPAPDAPDVLLVVVDTLRADVVLDPEVPTPNLDRLREEGTWAEYAIAPNNQTLPSHLTLLTGLDPEQHGMRSNVSPWPRVEQLQQRWEGFATLAGRFQAGGWRTAAVVSNILLDRVDKRAGHQDYAQGFDSWHARDTEAAWRPFGKWKGAHTWYGWLTQMLGYATEGNKVIRELYDSEGVRGVRRHWKEGGDTSRLVNRWLDGLVQNERPYFFFAHYMDPHGPYVAPEPYRDMFADPSVLPPGSDTSDVGEAELRAALRDLLAAGANRSEWGPYADFLWQRYREEVAYTDFVVGQVLDKVRESGRPTVVLFTSDHGEAFGEHEFKEHGHTLHSEEVRVPFILTGPGVPTGKELEEPVELVDAAYTLVDLAGLPTDGMSGRNVLAGGEARPQVSVARQALTVREGPWMALFRFDYGPSPTPGEYTLEPLALFDVRSDPSEQSSVLEREAAAVDALRAWLQEERLHRDLFPSLKGRRMTDEQRDLLSEMGYTEGQDDEEK